MRIQLIFDRKRKIDYSTIYRLVEKEIYLRPMSMDDLVNKIIVIIEKAGIQVGRKEK